LRLRLKHIAVVSAIAAAGLATFAATGFGGQNGGGAAGQLSHAGDVKLKLAYLATGEIPLAPGEGVVQELNCPQGKQAPFSGGISSPWVSVVENNSSATNPDGFPEADWYQGASNLAPGGPTRTFNATLVCAKLK
jgi:hypothetical protein